MLTKNYYSWLASVMQWRYMAEFSNAIVVDFAGTRRQIFNKNSSMYSYQTPSGMFYNSGVVTSSGTLGTGSASTTKIAFGTGTTPPTVDDYTLSGDFIYTLSDYTWTSVVETTEADVRVNIVISVTNTGDAAVTIGEVGVFGVFYYDSGYSGYSQALMDRSVLTEPVTIPAGGSALITLTYKFPFGA